MSKEAMKLALDHLMNLQPILGNGLLEERQLAFIDPHIDCAIAALQEGLAEQPAQQTCNCRWEGEVQVQQCTLHEAHITAIHEWAERAKVAEAKLKEQPAPVQQGWTPNMPITEEMHRAACKVLTRANGLDGTPQRMVNAMLAAAPQPAQRKPLTDEEITSLWEKRPYFNDFARAIEAKHNIKENT